MTLGRNENDYQSRLLYGGGVMEPPILKTSVPRACARDVVVAYPGRLALAGVSVEVSAGRVLALTGPNGAGKSTLVEVLAGVRPVTAGEVRRSTDAVAFVPQRADVAPHLPVTVRDVVTTGLHGRTGPWRRIGRDGRRRRDEVIDLVGMAEHATRPFAVLSGGQRQRALLAMGLARGAELLLLDEPTTGLDAATTSRILAVLDRVVAEGATVVCSSHDPAVVERADEVVRLEEGRVVDATARS